MTFDKFNRRTHLYLGLLLTPWFLLYAVSGFVFNHPSVGSASARESWKLLKETPYRSPANSGNDEDSLARQLLRDQRLLGRYSTDSDDQGNFIVYRYGFLKTVRLTYYAAQSRMRVEEQPLGIREFLMSAHVRSGFEFPYALEILWSVIVDIVAVSIIAWIVSGLYIWWQLKRFRFWGWSALAAGLVVFVLLALGI